MNTEKEIKTVKALVEQLCKDDERCRNDDKWLTYRVFRYFTNIYIPYGDFSKLPAFETVKRCRAYMQNVEKKYPPTLPEIIKKRQSREKTFSGVFKG